MNLFLNPQGVISIHSIRFLTTNVSSVKVLTPTQSPTKPTQPPTQQRQSTTQLTPMMLPVCYGSSLKWRGFVLFCFVFVVSLNWHQHNDQHNHQHQCCYKFAIINFSKAMLILRIAISLNADALFLSFTEFASNFAVKFCEHWLDFNLPHE